MITIFKVFELFLLIQFSDASQLLLTTTVPPADCVAPEVRLDNGTCGCEPCNMAKEDLQCGIDGNGDLKYYKNLCYLEYYSCKDRNIKAADGCESKLDYCNGFMKNNNGIMECKCTTECPATDAMEITCGKTDLHEEFFFYNNCSLYATRCSTKKRINHMGSLCLHPGHYCNRKVKNEGGIATCLCGKCRNENVKIICGRSRGVSKWYFNYCYMKEIGCNEKIKIVEAEGKCPDLSYCEGFIVNKNGLAVCECQQCKDSRKDPVCGKLPENGEYRLFYNECYLRERMCKEKVYIEVQKNISKCGSIVDWCEGMTKAENGEAICNCLSCSNSILNPTCGQYQDSTTTDLFFNDCHRMNLGCHAKTKITRVPLEKCEQQPECKGLKEPMCRNGLFTCECDTCEGRMDELVDEFCDANQVKYSRLCSLVEARCLQGYEDAKYHFCGQYYVSHSKSTSSILPNGFLTFILVLIISLIY